MKNKKTEYTPHDFANSLKNLTKTGMEFADFWKDIKKEIKEYERISKQLEKINKKIKDREEKKRRKKLESGIFYLTNVHITKRKTIEDPVLPDFYVPQFDTSYEELDVLLKFKGDGNTWGDIDSDLIFKTIFNSIEEIKKS